jgi:hypothetical protein
MLRRVTVRPTAERRGAATVEFALVLPLFLMLLMGMVELGSAINCSQTLHGALRDAGRVASMDFQQIFAKGVDPNVKVTQDIRNLLTAAGIPGDEVTIDIVYADGPLEGQPFDLDNEDNYLALFRIEATIPYSKVSALPLEYMSGQNLTAFVTFRMGRVSLSA